MFILNKVMLSINANYFNTMLEYIHSAMLCAIRGKFLGFIKDFDYYVLTTEGVFKVV